jgi:YVTN family beta-propeller protein
VVALAVSVGIAGAESPAPAPGPQPDGTAITPEGWHVTPAGEQSDLGSNPVALAVSPDGSQFIVTNAGYRKQSIQAIDASTGAVTQTIGTTNTGWAHTRGYYAGVAYSPDGASAYASDGPEDGIHVFSVDAGALTEQPEIAFTRHSWPAGIAVSDDGSRAYIAANMADELLVVDLSTGETAATASVGHRPFGVALNHAGSLAFVTNWGGNTVSVVRTKTARVVDTIRVGLHPSALALSPTSDELYVANTDSDTVSVIDTATSLVLREIDLRPYAGARIGTSPNGLAVSPDGSTLYVANAGNNDVAVVKLAPLGSTVSLDRVTGLIPTGWYPSAVALDGTGSTLLVLNMHGLGTGPVSPKQYIGAQMQGTLSRIPVPNPGQLAAYTAQVSENDRFVLPPSPVIGNPIPSQPGDTSPIKHVIYVLKENRTYDQVLGDLKRGNGDPSYEMFPASVTPNQHRLARRFVTLDNFYTDGAVSADGWAWSTEAYANSYVEKNWPPNYGIYGHLYDFGGFGSDETAGLPGRPGNSFLWDRLAQAGISYRNYGYFVNGDAVVPKSMPNLRGHTDHDYPGWDLGIPDQVRIAEWLKGFAADQKCGCLPTVEFVYLPQDHTKGTASSAPQPSSMVADNDYALGQLVDAVSHSQFWSSTAIFVVEDDAQDGPDHVSGHRTIAQVISPYTQTGTVDSTFYSTASMLRSIELILGVPPLTQFDATATPMYVSFVSTPNLQPYDAVVPQQRLDAINAPWAPMARISSRMDWSSPDASSEDLLTRAIWKAVMGRRPMP